MTEVAIVTGASAGIGRLVAEQLVTSGHHVVGVARRAELLSELQDWSAGQPGVFESCPADLSDPDAPGRIYATASARGFVHVVVNVAGYGGPAPVESSDDDFLRPLFETNFFAPWSLIREALPAMRTRRRGTIVNMLSVCSKLSVPGLSAYCSSKFALYALSEALRQEVEPLGIRIVGVLPGFTKTDAWTRSREIFDEQQTHPDYDRVRSVSILDRVAARVGVAPERVADVVVRALEDPAYGDHHVVGIDGHLVNVWSALPGPLRRSTMTAATGFLGMLKRFES